MKVTEWPVAHSDDGSHSSKSLSSDSHGSDSLSSDILGIFRGRGEISRTELMQISGLSRSTINQRLAELVEARLVRAVEGGESTGGRPSTRFAFNSGRAGFLTADIGASGFTAALCDLAGHPLSSVVVPVNVWEGPERVLGEVKSAFDGLMTELPIWGVGVGVPGPVEFAAGRVVNPPIMTGWDRFDIAGWFVERYGVTVVVENDANARAVAESRLQPSDDLISLKIGAGIGAGLVFNGQIIRGNEGAAGDIGHTRIALADDSTPLPCRCGNVGCVEAYAGGWALVRALVEAGVPASTSRDVVDLVRQGNIEAVRLVRQAGRVVGDAVADLVSILNPRTIVLSGVITECDEVLLSGIRERVYQRTAPLATRNLTIRRSTVGELAGVIGLAFVTADRVLTSRTLDELIAAREPVSRQQSPE